MIHKEQGKKSALVAVWSTLKNAIHYLKKKQQKDL